VVRAVFTNEKRANRGIRLKRHASAHCHAEIACQIHFMKHYTLFLAIAALAATSCSLQLDSQYGIRLEPRRIVRPETEPPQSSASERAAESLSGLEHTEYVNSDVLAQPESPLEAPTAEFQAEEPLQKQRWVLEIPREEIPAMAQPLVEQMADKLNATQDTSTPSRTDNRAIQTLIRIVVGVLLICASLVFALVAFLSWLGSLFGGSSSDESLTYLVFAIVLFLGGIVLLAVGIFL
jgi:hypothetical protein